MAAIWVVLDRYENEKSVDDRAIIESKATGIGFRNYWASTIKEVLTEIEKKKYKEWKDQYGS